MHLYHDSRDPAFRSPGGAQPCGTEIRLCLRVEGGKPDTVYLRQWFGKESFTPMHPSPQDAALYEASIYMPDSPCLLWYDFQVWENGQFYWYGNAEDLLGGVGALIYGSARSYQITVYDPAFTAPDWTQGAVFYQIFPDRFARGSKPTAFPDVPGRLYHEDWSDTPALMYDPETGDNVAHDFFGGTLNGIREKLPYIASLGITGLYLNPIFSANTNHRYDTSDWMAIDPLLGTEADFRALCEDAKALGIHIVLDGVFSHSGDHNPFFIDATTSKQSPYRNWYQFEHWPDMYKSWWGFVTLPEIDKNQPEVLRYFLTDEDAVVKHWLTEGADGWRIDVADELPMPYLRLMRESIKKTKPDALILGEVWEDASNKISYGEMRPYCLGDTIDGVMNYPLRTAALSFLIGETDANAFKRRMDALYENYPPPFAQSLMNVLGSHDRARAVNILGDEDGADLPRSEQACLIMTPKAKALGTQRLKLMLQMIIAMPGMPCVYYGDEAGMEGCADPFNRGTFPWGGEDTELTAYFAESLERRRNIGTLTDGSLRIDALTPDVVCIRRTASGQTICTAVNRSGYAVTITVNGKKHKMPPLSFHHWEE